MKFKSIVFALLLSVINGLGYSQTKFSDLNLEQALAKAAKAGKKSPQLVFLDCYTSWCMPCRYMTSSIFTQPQVGEFFNSNFVTIKMDMEKGDGPKLSQHYGIKIYPTFLILNADGTEIGRIVGSSEADEFIAKVKFAMNTENSILNLRKKYNISKNLETGKLYINALKDSGAEYNDIVRELYNTLPFEEKFDKEFITLTFYAIDSPFDPLMDQLVMNQWKLNQVISESSANDQLKKIYSSYLLRVLWKTKGVKPSVEGIVEAAKGMARFESDPTKMNTHLGQITLLHHQKKINELLDYIENNLSGVAINEQKSVMEHVVRLVNEGSLEQKEQLRKYLKELMEVADFSKEGFEKNIESINNK